MTCPLLRWCVMSRPFGCSRIPLHAKLGRTGKTRFPVPRTASKLAWSSVVAGLLVGFFSPIVLRPSAGQNSHAGPVTGVIDGVAFESDQYYVHGWACQEGNRGSIAINIYANHAAGDKPPGTYVMAGTANLANEAAVDRECHDADGGKHRFRTALPNQLLRTFQGKKLYVHGIALAGNVENAAAGRLREICISGSQMACRSATPEFSGRRAVAAAFDTSKRILRAD